MVSTISLAENDDWEASDSVSQIGHLVAVIVFSENFTVKAPKCDYNGKQKKKQAQSED